MPKKTVENALTVSVRIAPETAVMVRELAAKSGISENRVMRRIIEDHFNFLSLPKRIVEVLEKDRDELGVDPSDLREYLEHVLVARFEEISRRPLQTEKPKR